MRLLLLTLALLSSLAVAAPGITSVVPSTGPTQGGVTLTVQGVGFDAVTTISVGGLDCPVTGPRTTTTLTCTLPAGEGFGRPVVATSAAGASNAVPFSYLAPSIAAVVVASTLAPGLGPTSGGTVIVITGANFGFNPVVMVGAAPCPLAVPASHTELRCVVPAGQGTATVTVTTAGQSGTRSATYAPLSIASISPASGPGIGGGVLILSGTSFGVTGGAVTIGGVTCPLQSQSHTEVRCVVPAGSGKDLPVVFTVGGQSSTGGFTPLYSYNPPVITSLSGLRPTAGGSLLTINGANFGNGAGVTIGGVPCPLTSQRDDRLICTLPEAPVGNALMLVVEVNGQSTSVPFFYAAPQVLAITPTTGRTAGGTLLRLDGENFGATGATVTVNSNPCAIVTQSHAAITCSTPPGTGRTVVTRVTFNAQFGALNAFSYLPPVVTGVVSAPAGGGPVTITGDNFGATLGASVTIGAQVCTVTAATHTSITCMAQAGLGTSLPLVVTVGGQASNTYLYSSTAPYFSAISGRTPTEGGTTLVLNGSSLGTTGATVTVGGAQCPVVSQSDTLVRCTLPAGQGVNVEVALTVGGRTATGTLSYEAPGVVSAAPNPGARDGGQALVLDGANFGTSASVTVGSAACPVTAQGHAQLTCTTPAGRGPAPIVVRVSGQQSNVFAWRYANSPPAAPSAQALTVAEDVTDTFLLTVSDADLDPVSWSLVSAPSVDAGVVTFDGGLGPWQPAPNFNGTATFRAVASDGEASSAETLVTVTVTPRNDAPVALPVSGSTDEDVVVTIAPQGSDVDGDALTTLVSRPPDAGVATVTVDAQQRLVVTPALDYRGAFSFGYRVRDGALDSNEAEVTVQVASVNDAPVATGRSVTGLEDAPQSISLLASDVDGDALSFSLVAPPASGTVSISGAVATFTPAPDFTGSLSFTFRASDGVLFSNTATVVVGVSPVNDAPIASDVSASTTAPQAVTFALPATDVDGDALTFQVTRAPALAEGTVTVSAGQATFTPAAGFSGTSTFDFEARDPSAAADTATATVTVQAQDLAPTFRAPTPSGDVRGRVGEVLSFTLAADDDHGPLSYDVRGRPAGSTLDTGSGVFSWTPTAADVGTVPVVLVASDGVLEATRAVSLVIAPAASDAGTGGGAGGGSGAGGGDATGGGAAMGGGSASGGGGGSGEPSGCGCSSLELGGAWFLLVALARRRSSRRP